MAGESTTPTSGVVPELLAQLIERRDLTREQARAAMEEILSGGATPSQIGGFIVALRMKGETAEEVIGLAQAVRSRVAPVRPQRRPVEDLSGTERDALLDTCGTGGDASGTFNISTATALIVAACGVPVAKHCNRSISSKCGSADVVEALGVNINLSPERMAACIDEAGIGFLFAPLLHSAWKYAQPVRRELRVRTVFNMLGPICNPANASMQVAGVYEGRLVSLVAHVLAELGSRHGFVVHGSDGLDEITTTGDTQIAEVKDRQVRLFTLRPEDAGLTRSKPEELLGGDVAENVRIIREVLDGGKGPKRDIVLLNAAAALVAAGKAGDFTEGVRMAAEAIDSGAAKRKLAELAEFTNRAV